MRPLFRALKAGELVGITPDQQPKLGAGVFAPFFGRQALTLTLIPKLAERSGAPVLLAWAEPVAGGFDIVIEEAPAAIQGSQRGRYAGSRRGARVQMVTLRCSVMPTAPRTMR